MRSKRLIRLSLATIAMALVGMVATAGNTQNNREALVLKEQGSFFLGGEVKNRGENDDVTIHQTYVQYQVPSGRTRVPVVFTHGCCLSSKTWETTPDGRMGWDEYFVRNGHPVYLTDQSGRARSGFDSTPFNQVRNGELAPAEQPNISHMSHQGAWSAFRFGPSFNVPHPNGQFPVEDAAELYKQMTPDINSGLPDFMPTWPNLAELGVRVGGAVMVGHSQSGLFPFHAALINPNAVKGLINIEAGGTCHEDFGQTEDGNPSPGDIATLATIPTLMIYGDHLEGTTWQNVFEDCLVLVEEINSAGGNATMMHLPELDIVGNSHMLMQDRNSLQVADLILDWIEENVE